MSNAYIEAAKNILRLESSAVEEVIRPDGIVALNLDCFALTGTTIAKLSELSRACGRGIIVTIASVENPMIQILL